MESNKTNSVARLAIIFIILFILTILLAYNATAALTDDLVHCWGESLLSDNTTVVDSLGTMDLAANNSKWQPNYGLWNTGAYFFDGTNDLWSSETAPTLSGDVTIMTWYNKTSPDDNSRILDRTGGAWNSGEYALDLRQNDGSSPGFDCVYHDGTSIKEATSSVPLVSGNWQMGVCVFDETNSLLMNYLDGTNVNNASTDGSHGYSADQLIVGDEEAGGRDMDGHIQTICVWNRSLTPAEITQLYNGGVGTAYPFEAGGPGATTDIVFKAADAFNSSTITNFGVNVSWPNGTTEYQNSITGNVTFLNVSDNNISINVTFNTTDYFSLDIIDQNIVANTTNTITGSMYQAVATLTAFEKISNNSLSDVTFYIGDFNGTVFNISAGTHTVIAEKEGYYNLTGSITVAALSNTSYNIEGMYSSIIDFTAYNNITNASISSFTISTEFGEEVSTINGTVFINAINNTNYTFNISSPGAFATRLNLSFIANDTTFNVNTSLSTFNSVTFNIYNESNGNLLNQSVLLNVIFSDDITLANTTSTGTITIQLLEPKDYEVRFESDGFNPRSIFLTVTNDSTQSLDVYMTENTSTELQIIEVLDTANQPIEGAIVWLQKEQLNSTTRWITIQEAETDYAGKTSVFVERDVSIFYRFAVIVDGESRPIQPSGNLFTGKTSFIPGIEETIQLIIDLQDDPTDFISDALAIAVNCSLTNLTATCIIVDGRNSITGAVMRIEASYINESLSFENIANVTFTGSSGTLEYNITDINNSIWRINTYVTYETSENLVWSIEKKFDVDVLVDKNTGLFYAIIVLAVVFLLTVKSGPLVSGLIGFAALIPLSYIKIISIPTGIITGLLALVIIFFFRTRKLDD